MGENCCGHLWAVTTLSDSTGKEYFHHHGTFYLDSDGIEFKSQSQTDSILAISLASSMNLVNVFPQAEAQFSHLQSGDNKSVSLHALLVDL